MGLCGRGGGGAEAGRGAGASVLAVCCVRLEMTGQAEAPLSAGSFGDEGVSAENRLRA